MRRGIVGAIVNAQAQGQVFALGGRADDDFLGAGLQVFAGVGAVGEDARALDRDVDGQLAPGERGRIAFLEQGDGLAVNDQLALYRLHVAGVGAVVGVVFEQVRERIGVIQIIHGHQLQVVRIVIQDGLGHLASDTPKPVNGYSQCHCILAQVWFGLARRFRSEPAARCDALL